jgi:hypothetical protein
MERNKKGQIAIFIILALILVVLFLMIFLLRKPPVVEVIDEKNPQSYIDSCTRDAVKQAIVILSENGGDIQPRGSTMYHSINRTYLCYNANFYLPCINQRPLLIEHLEDEITNYATPLVEQCFVKLRTELEKKYSIEMGGMQLSTKLQSKQVSIKIEREFKMTRGNEIRELKEFKINLIHPLYDIAEVAMEISSQESRFCNFDILSYMIFYPDYNLNKYRPGNGDVIYQIKHIPTNQEFWFAVRSCALPPGF